MHARREPSLRIMRHSLRRPPSRCETPPPGRAPSYLRLLSRSALILFLRVVAGHDFQPPNVTGGSYGSLSRLAAIPSSSCERSSEITSPALHGKRLGNG